jgi:hypothetical protein
VGGLVLTIIGPIAAFMMIVGPLADAAAGALSGTLVADRTRARTGRQNPGRLAAGLNEQVAG